mmetsp:Transcript_11044/g.15322  ORF Transcript_11044/g.15322 Transcript_11044/m.15322 type:complete len:156 (-) Transcript_11044:151-618(-)
MAAFRASDGEGQSSDPNDSNNASPDSYHVLPKESDEFDAVTGAIDKLKPALSQLSFGAVVGYCSGAAAKKVGKAIAVLAGVAFIALQSAVYSGYIDVDWKKVQDDAVKKIDTDGDGEITAEDAKNYWKKVKAILTDKVPDAGGFSLGFLYGLKTN